MPKVAKRRRVGRHVKPASKRVPKSLAARAVAAARHYTPFAFWSRFKSADRRRPSRPSKRKTIFEYALDVGKALFALLSFRVLGAIVIVWLAAVLIKDIMERKTAIEQISVPKTVTETGYTPDVAANRLRSAMDRYAKDALNRFTLSPDSQMKIPIVALQSEAPKVVVPTVGISLDTIAASIRGFLGGDRYRSISGEMSISKGLLWLRLRLNGREFYSSQGGVDPDSPDELFVQALPKIFAAVEPYIAASAEKDDSKAFAMAEGIIARFPESNKNVFWSYILMGTIHYRRQAYDKSIDAFKKAIYLDPEMAFPHVYLGLLLQDRAMDSGNQDDIVNAIAEHNEAIRLDSKSAAAFYSRGVAYARNEEPDRALADFDEAIRVNPQYGPAFHARGHFYKDKGQIDRAIEDYTQAIKFLDDAYVIFALSARGDAYEIKGDLEHAIADYTEAIRRAPESAALFVDRGDAYMVKRDIDLAIADYTQAIRLDAREAETFGKRAAAYLLKGDIDLAIADFTEAIKLDPKNAGPWNGRCWARAMADQLEAALADCNQSLRVEEDANTYDSRAFVYLKMGQLDDAIQDYGAALQADPKLAQSLYGRGVAKRKKGDAAGGDADIAAAQAINAKIADEFIKYGVK